MKHTILLLALVLTGCAGARGVMVKPDPVLAQCDQKCFTPCKVDDTGIRWEGDPRDPKMWDNLTEDVLTQLKGLIEQCDVNRQACTKCLDNLKDRKVINY